MSEAPHEMDITCVNCENIITINMEKFDGTSSDLIFIKCSGCDASLSVTNDGEVEEVEEDIEDEAEEEDPYDDRKGNKNIRFRD